MKAVLSLLVCVGTSLAAPVPKELRRAPVVDLRDPDGKVLIPAADLLGYDWETHTLTLRVGAKAKLFAGDKPRAASFAVCVDGTPAFDAWFYVAFLGGTYDEPGLVYVGRPTETETELHIAAAYPDDKFALDDKRQVPALKAALEKAGKLKAEKK